ncbi:MAG: hypothetical protein CMJ47_08410 [Planctomyces sp.]|nr:hypothetical protein [Planctomyces sp.]
MNFFSGAGRTWGGDCGIVRELTTRIGYAIFPPVGTPALLFRADARRNAHGKIAYCQYNPDRPYLFGNGIRYVDA